MGLWAQHDCLGGPIVLTRYNRIKEFTLTLYIEIGWRALVAVIVVAFLVVAGLRRSSAVPPAPEPRFRPLKGWEA